MLYSLTSDGDAIVLDEPFTYLHNEVEIAEFNEVIHAAKQQGKSVVVATHSIEWIEENADDLALLDREGQIWAIGSVDYFRN